MKTNYKPDIITTDKEAFEYAVKMLIKQGEKSMNSDDTCMYRGYKQETLKNAYEEIRKDYPFGEEELYEDFEEFIASVPPDAMCAVGYLISDTYYDQDYENNPVDSAVLDTVKLSNPDWFITDNSVVMLTKLQKVHDTIPVSEWEENFKIIANFREDGTWNQND